MANTLHRHPTDPLLTDGRHTSPTPNRQTADTSRHPTDSKPTHGRHFTDRRPKQYLESRRRLLTLVPKVTLGRRRSHDKFSRPIEVCPSFVHSNISRFKTVLIDNYKVFKRMPTAINVRVLTLLLQQPLALFNLS